MTSPVPGTLTGFLLKSRATESVSDDAKRTDEEESDRDVRLCSSGTGSGESAGIMPAPMGDLLGDVGAKRSAALMRRAVGLPRKLASQSSSSPLAASGSRVSSSRDVLDGVRDTAGLVGDRNNDVDDVRMLCFPGLVSDAAVLPLPCRVARVVKPARPSDLAFLIRGGRPSTAKVAVLGPLSRPLAGLSPTASAPSAASARTGLAVTSGLDGLDAPGPTDRDRDVLGESSPGTMPRPGESGLTRCTPYTLKLGEPASSLSWRWCALSCKGDWRRGEASERGASELDEEEVARLATILPRLMKDAERDRFGCDGRGGGACANRGEMGESTACEDFVGATGATL